jgi:hypothetical protein
MGLASFLSIWFGWEKDNLRKGFEEELEKDWDCYNNNWPVRWAKVIGFTTRLGDYS